MHHKAITLSMVFATVFIILFVPQFGAAIRPWHYKEQLLRKVVPNNWESLSRGPVPPSAGNPCSNVPHGSGKCKLDEMNVAGRRLIRSPPPPPPAFLGIDIVDQKFAAEAGSGTSMENKSYKYN
ncbi:hypothetical protein CCACVL1_27581 [Corchorus capsularis]|uniref:Uncharacterized protein n=1 Tax=Corchorus capsularis TaxID=210143 RepID=A0A1R3G9K9_COCAP|nr:hypothetical protein CCACVL1_27581 [Corchorus capsularis]